jgi:hypothetical protein
MQRNSRGLRIVVQAQLGTHLGLEVLLGGKLHAGKPLGGMVNRGLCETLLRELLAFSFD